ncbi:MAG: hypothetical protein LVQ75_04145 [Candidatus Babeliales bacterium]|jgi:large subunit ribosomal protein L24
MMRVKKNDKVLVISGKDKGKTSSVIAISPKTGKIMVKDVAVTIRHVKARKQGDIPGIKRRVIHLSFKSNANLSFLQKTMSRGSS